MAFGALGWTSRITGAKTETADGLKGKAGTAAKCKMADRLKATAVMAVDCKKADQLKRKRGRWRTVSRLMFWRAALRGGKTVILALQTSPIN